MPTHGRLLVLVLAVSLAGAARAEAQRLPFERSFEVKPSATLDVSTFRGKIFVTAGQPGRVVIRGTVTVRVGWNVPANARELARRVADRPPITQSDTGLQLRPPSGSDEQRAVTVAYEVQASPDMRVVAVSDSGAISVSDIAGAVDVKTQSAAISIARLGGAASVTTGSGAVTVNRCAGALRVQTASSAIDAHGLGGGLFVRTQSGNVDASLVGPGEVDVQTGSSAITLRGVSGALSTLTRSGRTIISGTPVAAWDVSAGSSSIEVTLASGVGTTLDAESGSGSVSAADLPIKGHVEKRRLSGAIEGGGPRVRLFTRSGSIRVTRTDRLIR